MVSDKVKARLLLRSNADVTESFSSETGCHEAKRNMNSLFVADCELKANKDQDIQILVEDFSSVCDNFLLLLYCILID